MRKLVWLLAVAFGTAAVAHEEEMLADARAKLADARVKLTEAAREIAEATREQLGARSDRATLGVFIADQSEQGVVVGAITPDGGADAAGLLADDVITEINGESLTGLENPGKRLREILDGVESGDPVKLVFRRDGEASEVEVVTVPAYRADRMQHFGVNFDWLPEAGVDFVVGSRERLPGIRDRLVALRDGSWPDELKLVDVGEDLGGYFGIDAGVLVLDTPAKSNLTPGDIIKRIDGADVASSAEAYRLLRGDGEDAAVEVRRKNRTAQLTVPKRPRRDISFFRSSHDGDVREEAVEIEIEETH